MTSDGISCNPTKIYHVSSIRKWTRLGRLLKRTSSTVDLVTINKRKKKKEDTVCNLAYCRPQFIAVYLDDHEDD